MTTLQSPPFGDVSDDLSARDVVRSLGESYALDLVEAAARTPKTPTELSETTGAPIATTYRRIETLVDAGVLEEAESPPGSAGPPRGRPPISYRCAIGEVRIRFDGTGTRATIENRSPLKARIEETWEAIQ